MEYNKTLTTEEIHSDMRTAILSHQYSLQDFILEKDVCEKYGISKAVAKEVLHRLCTEGFLQSFPRRGYMLRMNTRQDYHNLTRLRIHVEKLVLQLVIEKIPPETIRQEFFEAGKPYQDMSNAEFHMKLANLLDDQYIEHTMNYLLGMIVVSFYATYPNATESQMTNCHGKILDALLKKDEEAAVAALYEDTHYKDDFAR